MASTARTIIREGLPPLSYIRHVGNKKPGIVYIGGFMSTKTGAKPSALYQRYAKERDYTMVCFDYTDKGDSVWQESDKAKQKIWSFEQWRNDVLKVVDELTEGPQILIGSSMGGWISLLTAIARPTRVCGVITIASAVGFTSRIKSEIPKELMPAYERGDMIELGGALGSLPIRKRFIEEGNAANILAGNDPIKIDCPVTLLHCTGDKIAPAKYTIDLVDRITSSDVNVYLHKTGDHYMSSECELNIIYDALDKMILKCKCDN